MSYKLSIFYHRNNVKSHNTPVTDVWYLRLRLNTHSTHRKYVLSFFTYLLLHNYYNHSPMDNIKIQEVAINLELLIRCRFYQMFNPNGIKIKNWNVYQLVCVTITATAQLVIFYATFGFFVETDDVFTDLELIVIVGVHIQNYICLLKISVFLCHANTIWDLFDVARFKFLTSKLCRNNIELLNKSRDVSTKLTNAYSVLTLGIMTQWLLFPIVINKFVASENVNHRLYNIFNFRFPVTLNSYNNYYAMFCAMEIIVAIFFLYVLLVIDVFLISFCWVINAQHEILTLAFEQIDLENQHHTGRHR